MEIIDKNLSLSERLFLTRTFHPVGQGAFYTEVFHFNEDKENIVVYDCGTDSGVDTFAKNGGSNIATQIQNFAVSHPNAELDTVFISHLHDDHISGLANLTNWKTPKRIVLPMLPLDVLIATRVANLIRFGNEGLDSDRIIRHLYLGDSDGGDELVKFKEIYGVIPGDLPDGSSDSSIKLYPENLSSSGKEVELKDFEEKRYWRYKLFNSVYVNDARVKQLVVEIRRMGLLDANNELDVLGVIAHIKDLKDVYKKIVKGNHNLYTLVVESEPVDTSVFSEYEHHPGCVYFGDFIPSREKKRRFDNTIIDYKQAVGVIQVPHHGSKNNWRIWMIKKTDIEHCIISAGLNNGYRHPSPKVINSIVNNGANAHVVYENPNTAVEFKYKSIGV